MEYQCASYDPERFATNLRRDAVTRNLTWDNAKGQSVLIVQTPFGQSASDRLSDICSALSEASLYPGKFTEVPGGIWVRMVSAADKARNKGCPLNGEASTYTVFSCEVDEDICRVYEPLNQTMLSASCDIPLKLHVEIHKIMRTEGRIRKREVDTGFYEISFPADFSCKYVEGSLYCQVENLKVPVTRQMIEEREFYIKTDARPVLVSGNKGLQLV